MQILTRKIEIRLNEADKEKRKYYYELLNKIKMVAWEAANMGSSHLFMLDNSIPYLDDNSKEMLRFVGKKGNETKRMSALYTLLSTEMSMEEIGISDMLSQISQYVRKNYEADMKNGGYLRRSLRSYKGSLQIPFSAKALVGFNKDVIESEDGSRRFENITMKVFGIPFSLFFGRDRSGNRVIIERVMDGSYELRQSAIVVDDDRHKIFLLITYRAEQKQVELREDRTLYVELGIDNPAICAMSREGLHKEGGSRIEIGTAEEFLYRRRQIQEKLRRLAMEQKWSNGGHGRRQKMKATERYHKKEVNYIGTKLHVYSRAIINEAIRQKCGNVVLVGQLKKEDEAKEQFRNGDPYLLRNWSYYGFKDKIAYKAKMAGIKLTVEK